MKIRFHKTRMLFTAATTVALAMGMLAAGQAAYGAGPTTIGLGTAAPFAVLAGSTVTNTGATVITGDLGVSPGSAVTGFPPGTVNGTIHAADAVALQAQVDLVTAYTDAAGRTPVTAVATELGGTTLQAGVYGNTTLGLTGTLTLDGAGDPSSVFIFQAGSTLITASGSVVALINGASACNVFWQVGSSATLATTTQFKGNILALTSITLQTGATLDGRALARNGAVTLDTNVINAACLPSPSPSASPSPSPSASPIPSPSASPTATLPGAPTNVTATAGSGRATVSFSPPASNGGSPITAYTVTSSPGGRTATGASSPITVTGLTNGTAYTFTVSATNAVGSGPQSSPSNSVTPTSPAVPATDTTGASTGGSTSPLVPISIALLLLATSGLVLTRRPDSR